MIYFLDNANNMYKAFSLHGFEELQDLDDDLADNDDEHLDDDDYLEDLPKHIPCFAHTLNLVVRDGFEKSANTHDVLTRTASLVSHIRRSTSATDHLDGERRVQSINVTR